MPANLEVFELSSILDDPRFEGFGIDTDESLLGRLDLDEDLTPGFGVRMNPDWQQTSLGKVWRPLKAVGRVAEFNDYPCANLMYPVFSDRAVTALGPMLKENGELLPLISKTRTKYFLYNILTISDALDCKESRCSWRKRGLFADEIQRFVFHPRKIKDLLIFSLRVYPELVLVTRPFVDCVLSHQLKGFSFRKVWPLPKGADWEEQAPLDLTKDESLKCQTMVIVLPLSGMRSYKRRIVAFEASVDQRLQVKQIKSPYLGSLELREVSGDTCRLFFSTPDANQLFTTIRPLIKRLDWPNSITVYLRNGGIYDRKAEEVMRVIEPS
jgi:hypothetical protein